MISIVCIYNNNEIFSGWLLDSLKKQSVPYELIAIDNTEGAFGSAAAALNHGGMKARGDYVMFAHQDVRLCSDTWLEDAEAILPAISALGPAGAAGMRECKIHKIIKAGRTPDENFTGVVYQGKEKKQVVAGVGGSHPIEVQTLDELLLIIPITVYKKLKFDEQTCLGWHLYAADYALSARSLGFKAYVLQLPVWHLSAGSLDKDYFRTLRKVLIKHRKEDCIYTTCGFWYTSFFRNYIDLLLRQLGSSAKRWLGINKGRGLFHFRHLKWLILG